MRYLVMFMLVVLCITLFIISLAGCTTWPRQVDISLKSKKPPYGVQIPPDSLETTWQ